MQHHLSFAAAALGLVLALGCTPSAEQQPTIPPAALASLVEQGDAPRVLDVRTRTEYDAGHVPGAINIPHTELPERLAELGPPGKVVVYCERGGRAARAEETLRAAGFAPVHLQGDMSAWRAGDFPTERGEGGERGGSGAPGAGGAS